MKKHKNKEFQCTEMYRRAAFPKYVIACTTPYENVTSIRMDSLTQTSNAHNLGKVLIWILHFSRNVIMSSFDFLVNEPI
jgi:hypothetical protein